MNDNVGLTCVVDYCKYKYMDASYSDILRLPIALPALYQGELVHVPP